MLRTHADAVCDATHLASFRELIERIRGWFFEDGPWWMCSFVFHLLLICSLALLGTQVITAVDPKEIVIEPPPLDKIVLPPIEIAPPEKSCGGTHEEARATERTDGESQRARCPRAYLCA